MSTEQPTYFNRQRSDDVSNITCWVPTAHWFQKGTDKKPYGKCLRKDCGCVANARMLDRNCVKGAIEYFEDGRDPVEKKKTEVSTDEFDEFKKWKEAKLAKEKTEQEKS